MPRPFQKADSPFYVVPEGTLPARLKSLVFLGWHLSTYSGETRWRELVGLEWQLAELGPQGQLLSVSEELTFSVNQKAKFHSRLKALKDPDEITDYAELLGRACLVTVEHRQVEDMTFANVANATALPKTMTHGLAFPDTEFTLVDIQDAPGPEVIARLPKRFQKRLAEGQAERPKATAVPPKRMTESPSFADSIDF